MAFYTVATNTALDFTCTTGCSRESLAADTNQRTATGTFELRR